MLYRLWSAIRTLRRLQIVTRSVHLECRSETFDQRRSLCPGGGKDSSKMHTDR